MHELTEQRLVEDVFEPDTGGQVVDELLARQLDLLLARHPPGPEAEDKLVEGFVFTLNTLRAHALLQRLLATQPETVLPFLTVESDSVITTASSFLAYQLAAELRDDTRTKIELLEVAEVTVRIILSFVLTRHRTSPSVTTRLPGHSRDATWCRRCWG